MMRNFELMYQNFYVHEGGDAVGLQHQKNPETPNTKIQKTTIL